MRRSKRVGPLIYGLLFLSLASARPASADLKEDLRRIAEDLEAYYVAFDSAGSLRAAGVEKEAYSGVVRAFEFRPEAEAPRDHKDFPRTTVNFWESQRSILRFHESVIALGIRHRLSAVYELIHHEILNLASRVELTSSREVASIYRESQLAAFSPVMVGLRASPFGFRFSHLICEDLHHRQELRIDLRKSMVCDEAGERCQSVKRSNASFKSDEHPESGGVELQFHPIYAPMETVQLGFRPAAVMSGGEIEPSNLEVFAWDHPKRARQLRHYRFPTEKSPLFRCRAVLRED